MAKPKTVGQKKKERDAAMAAAPTIRTGDRVTNTVASIQKRLGADGSVRLMNQIPALANTPRRSTGIPSLDYLLGGGLPMPGQIEFGGPMSVGKSLLAMQAMKYAQRHEKRPCLWLALEPYSISWMRQVGLWIPFSETEVYNTETGEMEPADPFAKATEVELERIQELGIEDVYSWDPYPPIYLMQGVFGDACLQAVVDALYSNEFAIIVVDSLGMAKSEDWVSEKGTQDASDFDRSVKLIGNYTARVQLAQNQWYDENNNPSGQGTRSNQTTVINLQQIIVNLGSQSHSPWAQMTIKGGEASKHNHHSINAFLQSTPYYDKETGDDKVRVGHKLNMRNLKSKIGVPYRGSELDVYTQRHGPFLPGDVDVAKDAIALGLHVGVLTKQGNHHYVAATTGEDGKTFDDWQPMANGGANSAQWLRDNPEWLKYTTDAIAYVVRRGEVK